MFSIFITGFPGVIMPAALSSLATLRIALLASPSYLAPVHTILPVLKMRVHVRGLFSLKASPGKTCGRYSTCGKAFTTASRSTG